MQTHLRSSRARRRLVVAALGGMGAIVAAPFARGQGRFPAKPVRLIVPFGPGGLADISARMTAERLGERLGQAVVIDNRPGAGGVVAAQAALNAPRDGHTIVLFSNGTTIAVSLLKLPYDPERDFVPVSSLAYFDLNLLVKKDSSFATLADLLAEAKRRPLTFGTINPGSTQHLSAELFKSVARAEATMVPFKTSGEVQTALLRGDVDVGFESYAALRGAIDAGQLRALATTGPARTAWLPKVPTVREAGLAGYEVTGWNALYATSGTPAEAVALLTAAMRDVMAQPDLRKNLTALGVDPRASTPAELAAVFERDRRKWAQVIKVAGIRV